jgi:hypothetical protein
MYLLVLVQKLEEQVEFGAFQKLGDVTTRKQVLYNNFMEALVYTFCATRRYIFTPYNKRFLAGIQPSLARE